MTEGSDQLLERASEIGSLRGLIEEAQQGSGGVVVVAGEPGIGKSSLLSVMAQEAREAGLLVLSARGGELEQEIGFGVVRQLMERTLLVLDSGERDAVLSGAAALGAAAVGVGSSSDPQPSGDLLATMHGLYWILANLADRLPVVLSVDDAQWADSSSLGWLGYVANRISDLPVALVVGVRLHEAQELAPEVQMLMAVRSAVLRPGPLSIEGVTAFVELALGKETSQRVASTCMEVTGGNPFLVAEFCDAIARMPAGLDVGREELARIGPREVARNVLVRAARGGRDAVSLARSVAVAGRDVDLSVAARIGELTLEAARTAADRLSRAAILTVGRGLSFIHPLVRSAVYEDIPPSERASLHRRAAEVFDSLIPGNDRVAAHLVHAERTGDTWVVERLLEAGSRALRRGAPKEAISLLLRARAEPPPKSLRPSLMNALGSAHLAAGEFDKAEAAFDDDAGASSSPDVRLQAAWMAAMASALAGRPGEAAPRLRQVIASTQGASRATELRAHLELVLLTRGFQPLEEEGKSAADALAAQLRGESLVEAQLALGAVAFDRVLENRPAAEALELVGRINVSDLPETGELDYHVIPTVSVLIYADRLAAADVLLSGLADRARRRGSVPATIIADAWTGYTAMRAGNLTRAQAVAWRALELAREVGLPFGRFMPPIVLATVALEKGHLEEVEPFLDEAAEHGLAGAPGWMERVDLLRGQLALARGAAERAREVCLEVGRALEGSPLVCPAVLPWRSSAALAALAVGDRQEARQLASAEMELARSFGAPRPLAIALRALGSAEEGQAALENLSEAVAVARQGPDRLERARALVDLATVMRQSGSRQEARELLTEASELTSACGATVLQARAASELESLGIRRPRPVAGAGALTPSERRVADLAAAGHSNPQIAQALFLSRRTVEAYLTSAYRKLHIESRDDLARALQGGFSEPRDQGEDRKVP